MAGTTTGTGDGEDADTGSGPLGEAEQITAHLEARLLRAWQDEPGEHSTDGELVAASDRLPPDVLRRVISSDPPDALDPLDPLDPLDTPRVVPVPPRLPMAPPPDVPSSATLPALPLIPALPVAPEKPAPVISRKVSPPAIWRPAQPRRFVAWLVWLRAEAGGLMVRWRW